jgi:hypothetical protein
MAVPTRPLAEAVHTSLPKNKDELSQFGLARQLRAFPKRPLLLPGERRAPWRSGTNARQPGVAIISTLQITTENAPLPAGPTQNQDGHIPTKSNVWTTVRRRERLFAWSFILFFFLRFAGRLPPKVTQTQFRRKAGWL